ncbi:MAG TPA: DUF1697 domain-containing protein, partial [Allosphingosinicella sp.]|jgi:uncharacterized protein (DUF1697 family)|nr:DUF1697 domain-containing protein [Allosphingosinicella sp.]
MERMVALLRAVNVGGRKLPMAELRALCAELGWKDVATYIQSGNVVFTAAGSAASLEKKLEEAISRKFDLDVPAIVRTAAQWAQLADGNPFPEAAKDEPNRLQLLVAKKRPRPDAADRLMERAQAGESVRAAGDALWFHFPNGVAGSKLTPALIDKACGSPATGRNYSTVMKLKEMLEA